MPGFLLWGRSEPHRDEDMLAKRLRVTSCNFVVNPVTP